ncbi:hypothetical protein N656DRAFT_598158 [Canariomyces notabilis]|uniref:Uncharacterized protein n=1 Tax=Canariomyces notabilis TaxID=2074819 RepID=A0AAN6TFZ6_9PEZI|nr:hypothetical protein N656DRAFT_598158 [Canariomyces arenarius]
MCIIIQAMSIMPRGTSSNTVGSGTVQTPNSKAPYKTTQHVERHRALVSIQPIYSTLHSLLRGMC